MGAARDFAVRPVVSSSDWRQFHALKDRLYHDDPCYVRPLTFQRDFQLDGQRNPFYQHAERQAFICWEGQTAVGRIAAIVDRLHQQVHNDRVGCFGFFECVHDVDVAAGLLGAAERWLRQRGCDAMRGPLNPSMKSDFGILVEGHQHPPYIMMSHTSKFYHELLEKNGFAVLRSFFAIAMDGHIRWQSHEQHWAAYEKLCQKIRDRYPQITIRASSKACLGADIRRINELGNLVRAENWGFVPFTPAELDNTVAQLKRVLNPKITFLAEIGERLVGYIMAMPDLNWALQKTIGPWDWLRMPQLLYWLRRCERLRIFGLGVTPELRHSGLAGLLIKRLFDDWSVRYPVWELSWVDSENIRSLRAIRGFVPEEPYKKYHLYERPILPTPAT